jgi:predicted permease
MRDVAFAVRMLRRTPLVTGVAVLSLALGIGANAAVFSLFERVLRQPLPVPEPERLANLSAAGPKPGRLSCSAAGDCDDVFSYPMFRDLETRNQAVDLAAHISFAGNLAAGDRVEHVRGELVSGSYFPVLRLSPAAGRLLVRSDEAPGAAPVVVLAHDYWVTQLGSSARVVGARVRLNGREYTVAGVAPRGFRGTTLGESPDVFVPLALGEQVDAGVNELDDRRSHFLYVFGRLREGVSLQSAQSALNAVYRPIIVNVEAPLQHESAETMERFRAKQLKVVDGSHGQSNMRRTLRVPIRMLFAITALVLLIACANVANLLLARGASRGTEIAIRMSMGASRGRVIRQLLTESVVVAAAAGALSLLVASWTLVAIGAVLPAQTAASVQLQMRPEVVAFIVVLALATVLVFGVVPALHGTRADLIRSLREGSSRLSGGPRSTRFRAALVTFQISLALALLISAGLFARSLSNVNRIDLGIQPEQVLTFRVSPQLNGSPWQRSHAAFRELLAALAAQPGVSSVSAADVPVVAGHSHWNPVHVPGWVASDRNDQPFAAYNSVAPGFFQTLGMPLTAGRDFEPRDGGAASSRVAIVNEAFVRRFGLGQHAVGMHFRVADDIAATEIVGVVRDARYDAVKTPPPPQYFVPYAQDTTIGSLNFYVRSTVPAARLGRAVREAVRRVDSGLPVEDLKTMAQQVREGIVLDRIVTVLAGVCAALALLLAAIGLYGVLAYSVVQRTREFGLRMALGASSREVAGLVLRQVARMLVAGAAIGVVAAFSLGRFAESLLYGLDGRDPLVFLTASGLLTLVVFLAAYLPAARASRLDPMRALRYD